MGLRTMLQKHPKTGVYYFRKRYPLDVADGIGKAEFKRSLRTKLRKEADVRLVEAENDFNQQISYLRNKKLIPKDELVKLRKILEGTMLIPSDYGEITLDTLKQARVEIKNKLEILKEHQRLGTLESIKANPTFITMFEDILYRDFPLYEKMFTQPGFNPSSKTVAKYMDYSEKYRDEEFIDVPSAPAVVRRPKSPRASNGKTLKYAYEAWKSSRNPTMQSATEWKRAVRLFIELHGNIALNQITKQHVKEFREAIRAIPSRLPKKQTEIPLPKLLALAKAGKLNGKQRTAGAVNKLIVALSSMFDVMCDEDVMSDNPAKGLLLKAEDSNRLPYSIDDLNTLFHSPVFSKPFEMKSTQYPARFWLPLMALYTGARIGELSQAYVDDIITKGDVIYLSINALHEGKRLKTKSSIRDIPLHCQLLECGLLEYVERRKKQKEDRLFPDLTFSKHGGYTSNFSKWYGRYCKEIGFNDANKVFHSFRHNFKDACRDAEIPKDVHDRLTGHASVDVGSTYGLGYSVEKLNQYVQRIKYEGLNLKHLTAI